METPLNVTAAVQARSSYFFVSSHGFLLHFAFGVCRRSGR
jgi:hypothetical protein